MTQIRGVVGFWGRVTLGPSVPGALTDLRPSLGQILATCLPHAPVCIPLGCPILQRKEKCCYQGRFWRIFTRLLQWAWQKSKIRKKLSAISTWRFWNIMGEQKRKVRQFRKNGSNRRQMTQGFQIWSQNSNQTTFDQVIGQKRLNSQEIGKFPRFLKILTFYCQ